MMQYLGATDWFIRRKFIFVGIITGFLGSVSAVNIDNYISTASGSLFYNITLPKIKDIKYALNEKLLVYDGTVQKTYMTGWPNSFILDGKEYQYNPWKFKPIEKNRYKLYYLPTSKFVVRYEKLQ